MNSFGADYVINGHEHLGLYDLYKIISEMVPFYGYYDESKWNSCWVVTLTQGADLAQSMSSKQGDFDQYGQYAIPYKLMKYYSYLANLVNNMKYLNMLNMLRNSPDTNHVQTEHGDIDLYYLYVVPS